MLWLLVHYIDSERVWFFVCFVWCYWLWIATPAPPPAPIVPVIPSEFFHKEKKATETSKPVVTSKFFQSGSGSKDAINVDDDDDVDVHFMGACV